MLPGVNLMTEPEVQTWLMTFKAAWETQDTALFTSLFATGSAYRDTPFSVPIPCAAFPQFWSDLSGEQQANDMQFERVEVLDGDRASAFWRAFTARRKSGERTEGDDVMALSFDASGKCSDLREWQRARVAGWALVRRVFGNGCHSHRHRVSAKSARD